MRRTVHTAVDTVRTTPTSVEVVRFVLFGADALAAFERAAA